MFHRYEISFRGTKKSAEVTGEITNVTFHADYLFCTTKFVEALLWGGSYLRALWGIKPQPGFGYGIQNVIPDISNSMSNILDLISVNTGCVVQ